MNVGELSDRRQSRVFFGGLLKGGLLGLYKFLTSNTQMQCSEIRGACRPGIPALRVAFVPRGTLACCSLESRDI